MGIIHVLDTEVSNKIAAGEVVERPLSIVKELVENSIDAGASVITVEIKDGGISYIRVTDNGCGMSEEDAKICFLRHATSKIREGSDLDAIYTLGFRGEALSSIGAVSKVRLYTKRQNDSTGICVICEGGEILSSSDTGAPKGTVIEVSNLFYNTPARRKFLKKASSEGGYISDIFSRYVLAYPEISFKLIRDGKEVIFSAGDNKLTNAVYAVYGRDYARNMIDVDYLFNGIRVSGLIGKGTLTRANRNYESFFVNKRYVKSGIMIRALEEAYKNQIMISKFPTAILNLELDAATVDINVHPTKLECKFSNEQDVYQAVYHAVKNALYALPNVPEIESSQQKEREESPFKAQGGEQKTLEEIYSDSIRKSMKPSNNFKYKTEKRETPKEFDFSPRTEHYTAPKRDLNTATPAIPPKETPSEDEAFRKMLARAKEAEKSPLRQPQNIETEQEISSEKEEVNMFEMLDRVLEEVNSGKTGSVVVEDSALQHSDFKKTNELYQRIIQPDTKNDIFADGDFRIIGQLFETYILAQKDNRLLMIDQHAAHERLNFEELKAEMAQNGVNSQMMLEPVEVRLSGSEFAVFAENEKLFYQLGFECRADGNNSVIISAVPGDISWSDTEPLFTELLTQIQDMKQQLITEKSERLLYTISCKASIKANMEMNEKEMYNLVSRVFKLENINTCPHGRPIVISMTKKEIEKSFRRIV